MKAIWPDSENVENHWFSLLCGALAALRGLLERLRGVLKLLEDVLERLLLLLRLMLLSVLVFLLLWAAPGPLLGRFWALLDRSQGF